MVLGLDSDSSKWILIYFPVSWLTQFGHGLVTTVVGPTQPYLAKWVLKHQGITRCFVLNLSALETQEWRLTPLIWFGHLASLATWLEVLAQVSSSKNTSEKTGQNWSSCGSQFVLQG